MNINTPPKIATIIPKNYAVDVATNLASITIGFTTDLDPAHVQGNVRLQSKEGIPIPITLKYEYRTITVGIKQLLSPNTQYQVLVFGDGNLDDSGATGVRSALGVSMQGNAVINFTTMKSDAVEPPVGKHPANKSIVESVPAFNWDLATDAVRYEIQVSKSNTMSPVHWASENIAAPPVFPSVPFEDGVYYWRIRSIDKYHKVSDWSVIYVFNLDTLQESPVVDEDTVAPELGYDRLNPVDDGFIEMVDYFPKESYSNVGTNLKTIYFTVLGTVAAEDVSIEMLGESVMGDSTEHGVVTGTIEVLPQTNGTTIIAYTPDVLQNTDN